MRQYIGTDKRDPDAISKIDYFLRDVAAAIALLGKGSSPSGGGTIVTPPSGGVSDHGLLTGLADDDHLQYLLLAGRISPGPGQDAHGSSGNTHPTWLGLYSNADPRQSAFINLTKTSATTTYAEFCADSILFRGTNWLAGRRPALYTFTGRGLFLDESTGYPALYAQSWVGNHFACGGTSSTNPALGVNNSGWIFGDGDWRILSNSTAFIEPSTYNYARIHLTTTEIGLNATTINVGGNTSEGAGYFSIVNQTAPFRVDTTNFGTLDVRNVAPAAIAFRAAGATGQTAKVAAFYASEYNRLNDITVAWVDKDGYFCGDGSKLMSPGSTAGYVTLDTAQTITATKTFAPTGTDDCLNLTPAAGDCIVGTPGGGDIERFTTGANNVWRVLNTGEVAMGNVLTLYPTPGAASYFSLTTATLDGVRTGYLPNVNGTFIMVGSGSDPAGAPGTIAVVNRTGITAVISTPVKLTDTSAVGFYLINTCMACTVAGTGSVTLNAIYTDDAGSHTLNLGTLSMAAVTQSSTGMQNLYLASGNITWTTSGTFTGTHNLRIRAAYLGA